MRFASEEWAQAFRAEIEASPGYRRAGAGWKYGAFAFVVRAAPVAYKFGAAFIPVRKAGKLPWEIERVEYELEYGSDLLEIHRDAIEPGDNVIVVDDVLATGGTATATVRLIEKLGGSVAGLAFVIELGFLGGREKLEGYDVLSLVTYD